MTVSVAFVIPVRHPGSVRDWTVLQGYLRQTLASVAAQTSGNWECVVVANTGAPLPDMPDRQTQLEAYYDAVRRDKGLRIHAGLAGIADQTHVMVVDFDDFVHRRLVEHVDAHRDAAGWNISRGYVWSGGSWCFAQSGFYSMCGTSHLARRDLLGSFTTPENGTDIAGVKRRLSIHIFIHKDLAAQGNPLQDLPFAGAVHRIGNPQSTSGSGQLAAMMTPPRDLFAPPPRFIRNLGRFSCCWFRGDDD